MNIFSGIGKLGQPKKNKIMIAPGAIIEKCIKLSGLNKQYITQFYKKFSGEKFESSLSFDCDLDDDVKAYPQVLELLDELGVTAEFAVVGKLVEKYPKAHEAIINSGHTLLNHTYSHPNSLFNPKRFNQLPAKEKKKEIIICHDIVKNTLGYDMNGFRTPHFGSLNTMDVYTILSELKYKYSSSTIATQTKQPQPYMIKGVAEFPLSPSYQNIFSCYELWGVFRGKKNKKLQEKIDEFNELVSLGKENKTYLNFYFDPVDVVQFETEFKTMITMLKEKSSLLTYRQLLQKI